MDEQLKDFLNKKFHPYNDLKIVKELKEELYYDLKDKLNDLKKEGLDDETAFKATVDSMGDISEILDSINIKTKELQKRVGMDFSKSNLKVSDFTNVNLEKSRFDYSNLKFSDFANSDLSQASFKSCNLKGSNFSNSKLISSIFNSSSLEDVNFDYADFTDAKLNKSAFKGAFFKENRFENTDFSYSDFTDVIFDNQKFNNVSFDYCGMRGTSFRNAVLQDVSFKTDVKKTDFNGAKMDKGTYAILKGYKADLSNVKLL